MTQSKYKEENQNDTALCSVQEGRIKDLFFFSVSQALFLLEEDQTGDLRERDEYLISATLLASAVPPFCKVASWYFISQAQQNES